MLLDSCESATRYQDGAKDIYARQWHARRTIDDPPPAPIRDPGGHLWCVLMGLEHPEIFVVTDAAGRRATVCLEDEPGLLAHRDAGQGQVPMVAFGGKRALRADLRTARPPLLTLMYGPAVRCKRFGRSGGYGLASMYPASDWSV